MTVGYYENEKRFGKIVEIFSRHIYFSNLSDQLFVPSEYAWLFKAFDMMGVSNEDVLYDLGSGDGRSLVIAKIFFDVKKAIGIENNPQLVEASRENVSRMGKYGLPTEGVEVIEGNYLDAVISDGTVFYSYKDMYFDLHKDDIVRKFEKELSPKAMVTVVNPLEPPFIGYSSLELTDFTFLRSPPLFTGLWIYSKNKQNQA
jgi:hypothetical protein